MADKKKILVVDDEADVLTYLTTLFEDNGYETVSAVDGVEGFNVAKKEMPDLISLDITMPNQSGVRTYRQYKEDADLKDVPVIVVTAAGDPMRRFLKKLHMFPEPEGFINKPIDEEALIKMVAELIGQ
ncbi:MAG: response regulator [Deltaproteobacteria bacterium]|nr:response regulator [Deltaproteobacteria bacterium]